MAGVGEVSAIISLIEVTANAIRVCSTYIQNALDAPKTASKLNNEITLLQTCLGEPHALINTIDQGSPSEIRFKQLDMDIPQCEAILATVKEKLEKSLNKKSAEFGAKVIWPFKENEFSNIMSSIVRFRKSVKSVVVVNTRHSTRRIVKTLASQERSDIVRFLSSIDSKSKHNDIRSGRLEGTALWVLQAPWFTAWLAGGNNAGPSVLCCTGSPGVGKTIIMSSVIDHLQNLHDSDPQAAVIFIYCNYNDQFQQTGLQILRSCLAQLVGLVSKVPDELMSLYKNRSTMDLKQLEHFLTILSEQFKKIYYCVDALDELTIQAQTLLLRTFLLLCQDHRIFLTGRPSVKASVDRLLGKISSVHHADIEANGDDIEHFVKQKIEDDNGLHPEDDILINNDLKTTIVKTLVESSHGMFLLPALHIETVLRERTVSSRRLKLRELPEALQDAFESTLKRIQSQNTSRSKLAMDTLMWLLLSKRPLTVEELRYALAIIPGRELNVHEDLISTQELLEYTMGLVAVDNASSTARLRHFSLNEYLTTRQAELFPEGHARIALSSLTYLNYDAMRSSPTSYYKPGGDFYPFIGYAASFWGVHAREQSSREVVALACSFLLDQKAFEGLLAVWLQTEYAYGVLQLRHSVFHEVAYFGAETIIRDLLSMHHDQADSKDENGRTPLSWAAEIGNVAVVQLLLEQNDVEADSKDESGRTPLSWAARSENEAVVRLLLERTDVDAESKDNSGRAPLSWAAKDGDQAVVRVLLERTDVVADSKDTTGRTPLSRAAENGEEAVLRLLLERGDVEPDSKDNAGRTPFSWAAECGHEAVVQLLMEKGNVEANSKDNAGRTPLSWAAAVPFGNVATVQILLEHPDVEANSKDNSGRTPLSWAAAYGHEAIVQLLLENTDVEPELEDNTGRTPLSWAAVYGNEAVAFMGSREWLYSCSGIATPTRRCRE